MLIKIFESIPKLLRFTDIENITRIINHYTNKEYELLYHKKLQRVLLCCLLLIISTLSTEPFDFDHHLNFTCVIIFLYRHTYFDILSSVGANYSTLMRSNPLPLIVYKIGNSSHKLMESKSNIEGLCTFLVWQQVAMMDKHQTAMCMSAVASADIAGRIILPYFQDKYKIKARWMLIMTSVWLIVVRQSEYDAVIAIQWPQITKSFKLSCEEIILFLFTL